MSICFLVPPFWTSIPHNLFQQLSRISNFASRVWYRARNLFYMNAIMRMNSLSFWTIWLWTIIAQPTISKALEWKWSNRNLARKVKCYFALYRCTAARFGPNLPWRLAQDLHSLIVNSNRARNICCSCNLTAKPFARGRTIISNLMSVMIDRILDNFLFN